MHIVHHPQSAPATITDNPSPSSSPLPLRSDSDDAEEHLLVAQPSTRLAFHHRRPDPLPLRDLQPSPSPSPPTRRLPFLFPALLAATTALCVVAVFLFPSLLASVHSYASAIMARYAPPTPELIRQAHCLGFATSVPTPPGEGSKCPISPAVVVLSHFSELQQQHPTVLTHRPLFSCYYGTYLLIDEPTSTVRTAQPLWVYTLALSLALALNATLVNPSVSSDPPETDHSLAGFLHFGEWGVSRNEWEACQRFTPVKDNVLVIDEPVVRNWPVDSPQLRRAREWIRLTQSELADQLNTQGLQQHELAEVSVPYVDARLQPAEAQLPRVDAVGPGMTVRVKSVGRTWLSEAEDARYEPGLFPPALAVSSVLEARYIAMQHLWRHTGLHQYASVPALLPAAPPVAVPTTSFSVLSWLTSPVLQIAIPIRGEAVPRAHTPGALPPHAVIALLNRTISAIRGINVDDYPALTSPAVRVAGQDVLARAMFTVYSDGRAEFFAGVLSFLLSVGLSTSQVRLSVNGGEPSPFALIVESDVVVLSAYSRFVDAAAACYFNSESVKAVTGISRARFYGCRNVVRVEEGEKELRTRVARLISRKELQRSSVHPIVKDNWSLPDDPPSWLYGADLSASER